MSGVKELDASETYSLSSQRVGYHNNKHGDVILNNGLKAGLKDRMINLIALCGIIGPGVFIGMGSALANGGPVGLLVGFAIVGLVVLAMMACIGEMNSAFDFHFAIHGSRYVSQGFGATMAIFYVIIWATNIIGEYTSLTSSMEAYTTKVPTYGWYLIFWGAFTVFQLFDVSWWGECEYVLGFIKLFYLTGYYIFSIVYAAGGIKGHKPDNPFKNYPLKSGFKGIANSFVYAGVFYSGVEGVSVIAAEARNPRRAIPTAVRNTVFRIFYVYFGLATFYGLTVPYNDPSLNNKQSTMKSPMTIAMTHAGWENSKYFVTTMIWITCISSINTAIYFGSRSLFTLCQAGYGPKIFTKVNKRGIPYVAIHSCHALGFLSILSYSSGSQKAYSYIVNVGGVACFIVWTGICVTHIRFRKGWIRKGHSLESLPYKSPLFPFLNYFAIVIGVVLTLVQSWSCFKPFDYKTFIDGYILLALFPVFWFCYDFFYFKKGIIKYEEMDFITGKRPDLDGDAGIELDAEVNNVEILDQHDDSSVEIIHEEPSDKQQNDYKYPATSAQL
ncbi:(ZYRO0D09086g) [Zygosaccharomyces parabailii]|nr:(ZYRO0D09086g) [Zygosaccharomyces parabailii]